MPRRYLSFTLVPLALRLVACEESSPSSPPAPILDGGVPDTSTPQPDTGAPSNAVTVTVLTNDGPQAGVLVVFHDASGAVIETKTSGADGKAASTGATPAMASALITRGTERQIVTWTGVEAGDELSVNDFDFLTVRGSYDVSLTAPFGGATSYRARVGDCPMLGGQWNGQGAGRVSLRNRCVREQNAVLVGAYDGNQQPIAFAFAKNVALPANTTPVPVTVPSFAAPTNVTVTIANAPGEASVQAGVTEIVGAIGYPNQNLAHTGTPLTFKTAAGFADALQVFVSANYGGTSTAVAQRIGAAATASVTLDFADMFGRITVGTADESDPHRPSITWTGDGSTAGADGGVIRYNKYLGGDTQLVWTFAVAPGTTVVKAPALPAEAAPWLPTTDAQSNPAYLDIAFVESDLIPNYAAFRRQQGTLFRGSTFSGLPPLTTNGKLRISSWNDGT